MTIVRVALPVPLRQLFDYNIASDSDAVPGCRVLVPFGNRKLVGVIWQVSPQDSFNQQPLKSVLQLLDTSAVIGPALQQRLAFAADYYHYPLG